MRQLPIVSMLDHETETPIVLMGEPARMKGSVRLHNRADSRVVIREACLCELPSTPLAKTAAHPPSQNIPLVAILAPAQKSNVRVKAAIDPHTPPGSYSASLQVGDHRCPVVLHVAESVSLSVSPSVVSVENRPGSRLRKRLILNNSGNVPLVIGNIGAVILDDELGVCKTVRGMLAENTENVRTINDWVTAYLNEGKKQLDATTPLWADVEGAPFTLNPGETLSVDIAIRVPDSLDPRSRYQGVAFLYDTNIHFSVVPTGAIKEREPAGHSAVDASKAK